MRRRISAMITGHASETDATIAELAWLRKVTASLDRSERRHLDVVTDRVRREWQAVQIRRRRERWRTIARGPARRAYMRRYWFERLKARRRAA